jgi:hypothetical protein
LKKIIGIAAPARSGKDTVAAVLLRHPHVAAYALADPLKIGCQALFGLSDAETWQDAAKENAIPLWAHSPRQFFQHVGTDWMRAYNPEHWLLRAELAINPPAYRRCRQPCSARLHEANAPFKLAAQAFFELSGRQTWDPEAATIMDNYWNLTPLQMFTLIESLALRDFPDYYRRRAERPVVMPSRGAAVLDGAEVIIIKDIRFENEADFLRRHNGVIWHIVRDKAEKVNAHASEQGIQMAAHDVVIPNNGTLADLIDCVKREWLNLKM